jgi:hypothetical protein
LSATAASSVRTVVFRQPGTGRRPSPPITDLERIKCASKYRYGTEGAARLVLARVGQRNRKLAKKLDTYLCRACGAWHLTSHSQRKER